MSIMRQRRRQMILSGLLGFVLALVLAGAGAYFAMPYFQIVSEDPVEEIELPETTTAIVASRAVPAGSLLTHDDLMEIEVLEAYRVYEGFESIEDLVGRETALALDPFVPVTPSMCHEPMDMDPMARIYEISFVELPFALMTGDHMDVRIAFPTGQEYVVLSRKEVFDYQRSESNLHKGLVTLSLTEEEALFMSSALVDTYLAKGTRLYMARYINGDQQPSAVVNYPANTYVQQLFETDPNVGDLPDMAALLSGRLQLDEALAANFGMEEQPMEIDMTTPVLSFGEGVEDESSPSEAMDHEADDQSNDNNQEEARKGFDF